MEPHPEHNEAPQVERSRRRLLIGGFVAVIIVVIVLLHLLGVIHG